tara:strand:+ start:498 stop:773 length:276 start_codon:yes stop_codon:yes gene_type:complete
MEEKLNQNQPQNKVTVSFLEIYGEDVYDLLPPAYNKNDPSSHTTSNSQGIGMHHSHGSFNGDRTTLPVREDDKGGVFVQGLREVHVTSASL